MPCKLETSKKPLKNWSFIVNLIPSVPIPKNEPTLNYAPDSIERSRIEIELQKQLSSVIDIPMVIGGSEYRTAAVPVVLPHQHNMQIAQVHQADTPHIRLAVEATRTAGREWAAWSFEERAAIFLKAADLLAGPWRERINAATMLGQSKTVYQAEIDSACELIDFLRFNVSFAQKIYQEQPESSSGMWNQLDYRPLEGFVYAVTPFNFTAIAGNLAAAPVLMGNTVIWKPTNTASLSNYMFMQILTEAGLPPGVINFLPGDAERVSHELLTEPGLAGIHFTGSTAVFNKLWGMVSTQISSYRCYPRMVGETGGKDFVLAHASADVDALTVALVRGAFEYQGQKCSAASRAYISKSVWKMLKPRLLEMVSSLKMGSVTDFSNFMGAVIDARAFARISGYLIQVKTASQARFLTGGNADSKEGYFVEPTVIEVDDPAFMTMREEIFGPLLSVFVYEDSNWDDVLRLVDVTSPYALTGAIFAQDRQAVQQAQRMLRFAAGNFYINDKPTGAVVGQQPFGGGRASGTNDKAGSPLNLLRWVSPRTIKENFLPSRNYRYAHMNVGI